MFSCSPANLISSTESLKMDEVGTYGKNWPEDSDVDVLEMVSGLGFGARSKLVFVFSCHPVKPMVLKPLETVNVPTTMYVHDQHPDFPLVVKRPSMSENGKERLDNIAAKTGAVTQRFRGRLELKVKNLSNEAVPILKEDVLAKVYIAKCTYGAHE